MPSYSYYTTITSDGYANTTTPAFSYYATATEAIPTESDELNFWLKSFVLSESEQDDICFSKKTMEEVL